MGYGVDEESVGSEDGGYREAIMGMIREPTLGNFLKYMKVILMKSLKNGRDRIPTGHLLL